MALTPEQQILGSTPELQDVGRQRKLAELLMAQGMQQPQGQMISGQYVAPSFAQQLNPLANILAGQAVGERADIKQTELAAALRGKQQQEIAQFGELLKVDPNKAYQFAAQSQVPQLREAALKKMMPQEFDLAEGAKRYMTLPDGTTKQIASGGEKYRAPIQIDTGTAIELRDPLDPTRVISRMPKSQMPTAGQVVETANGPMLVNTKTGQAEPIMAGGQPLAPKLSAEQSKDITAINQQKAVVDSALNLVKNTPTAFSFGRGAAGALPLGETIAGRTEKPAETKARAAVFNIVSKVINERAGAAQSAQEIKRLNAFLPSEYDNATQIKNKFEGFKEYLNEQEKGTRVSPSNKPETLQLNSFSSEADVQKAIQNGALKVGDKVTVNGVTGTIR
jgi:hypothetical protein